MKRQSQKVFALVSPSGIALSMFLLSVGVASAQSTRSDASELTGRDVSPVVTLAQVLTQEQEELELLRQERRVQAQVQAEVGRTLGEVRDGGWSYDDGTCDPSRARRAGRRRAPVAEHPLRRGHRPPRPGGGGDRGRVLTAPHGGCLAGADHPVGTAYDAAMELQRDSQ